VDYKEVLERGLEFCKEWPIATAYLGFSLILAIGMIGLTGIIWSGLITFGVGGLLLTIILALDS